MWHLIKNLIAKFFFSPFNIELDPEKSLNDQLEELHTSFKLIYEKDSFMLETIEKINQGIKLIIKIAPEFDYNSTTHANGFWTQAILAIKFLKLLSYPEIRKKIGRDGISNLIQMTNIALEICYQLKDELLKKPINSKESKNEVFQPSLFTNKIDFMYLLKVMDTIKLQLKTIYEHFNFFWLGSTSGILQLITAFMAVYSSQWESLKIYNWFSEKKRAKMFVNMVNYCDVNCFKSMWSINDFFLIQFFLNPFRWFRCFWSSVLTRNIYIPRQNRWLIDLSEPVVHDLFKSSSLQFPKNKPLRCVLFYPNNNQVQNSLLIHVHGGGFISQSPESHSVYLDEWVRKLETIPILSIDYSLSPESQYPVALQEVLDCYLWIISNHEDVSKKLGFFPEKIALCGDSAGGNMSMSLLVVLSKIRQKLVEENEKSDKYRFPEGIFCFYSPFILTTTISPSRMITSIDGLVPLGALLNCLAAYVPEKIFFENNITFRSADTSKQQNFCVKTTNKILSFVKYFIITFQVERSKPWFQQTENLKQCLVQLNKFLTNPFASPLLSDNFSEFNEVQLHLYPLVYDPFLDDSIEIAKKWNKDKVHLHIVDEMPHGFLNFFRLDAKAKEKGLQCIEQIIDVLR